MLISYILAAAFGNKISITELYIDVFKLKSIIENKCRITVGENGSEKI